MRTCVGGAKEHGDPITPMATKAKVKQDHGEEWPRERVEGVRDVKLEKNSGHPQDVELTGRLLDEHEVVMDTTAGDECTLVSRHQLGQPRSKAKREYLGDKLSNQINQAYRPVV